MPDDANRDHAGTVARKAAVGFRWLAGLRATGQVLQWTTTILVVRLLDPHDYGLLAMAAVFIGVFGLFSEIGLEAALVQKREELGPLILRQTFGLLLLVNFGCAIALVAGAGIVSRFYGEPQVQLILMVLAAKLPIGVFGMIPRTLLLRRLAFRELALAQFGMSVVSATLTLGLAWAGFGVWSLVIGNLTAVLVQTLLLNWLQPFFHWPIFSYRNMREELGFGGFVLSERVLWYLYSWADMAIIGRLLGADPTGIYSVGKDLGGAPVTKLSPLLSQVAFPALSKLQGQPVIARHYYLRGVRLLSAIMFPVAFGMSAVAPVLIPVVLGEKWALSLVPLVCFSLIGPLRVVNTTLTALLRGIGRPAVSLGNTALAAVLTIAAVVAGAHWGVVGVSIGRLVSFPPYFIMAIVLSSKYTGIGLLQVLGAMSRSFAAAAIMAIGVALLSTSDLLGPTQMVAVSVPILLGVVIYGGLMMLIDRESIAEAILVIRQK